MLCDALNDDFEIFFPRRLFVQTIAPRRKNVVIMIDHGNSLSLNQLNTAKSVARHVLESLSENDRVSVLALSNKVVFAREDHCLTRYLVPLTDEARTYFNTFSHELSKQQSKNISITLYFVCFVTVGVSQI